MPPTKSEERVRQARALSSNSSNSHIDKAWYRYALMGIGDDGLAFVGACMYFGIFQNDHAMLDLRHCRRPCRRRLQNSLAHLAVVR